MIFKIEDLIVGKEHVEQVKSVASGFNDVWIFQFCVVSGKSLFVSYSVSCQKILSCQNSIDALYFRKYRSL